MAGSSSDADGAGVAPGTAVPGVQPGELPAPRLPSDRDFAKLDGTGEAKEVKRRKANLERRLADEKLVAMLREHDFQGSLYDRFENELAAYGLAVMRGWLYTGHIFKLTAARSLLLAPTGRELEIFHRDSDARQILAGGTVAATLPRFKTKALKEEGWRSDGGASLPTYFMGAGIYTFPNQLRAQRTDDGKWNKALFATAKTFDPDSSHIDNPAVIVTTDEQMRDQLDAIKNDRTRRVVALYLDGYSHAEISVILDLPSDRAVEGIVHRWRTKEKETRGGGT